MKIVADPEIVTEGRRVGAIVIWPDSPYEAGDYRWDPGTTEPLVSWAKKVAETRPPLEIDPFLVYPGF
jgi:hypothetical protein